MGKADLASLQQPLLWGALRMAVGSVTVLGALRRRPWRLEQQA